jgi:hypothetical protein
MAEAPTPSMRTLPDTRQGSVNTCTGFVAGVVVVDGRLRSGRREVVLFDHGTGAAGAVAATVLLEADQVEALTPLDDPATIVLEPLHLELLPAGDAAYVILADDTREPESRRLAVERDWVADRLVKRFTHDRLGPAMPGPLLHGGAVVMDDGATALVVGPSGSGKSTLVAHLAHSGCALLNDEQVSVHVEAGLLGGFTRPIDVKAGGVAHLPPVDGSITTRDGRGAFVTARQLGTRHRLTGTPALLVLPERSVGADGSVGELLHPAQALDVLCANNLDLARDPRRALESFAWLAATVPMVVVRYEDARSGAAAVLAQLEAREPRRAVPWEVVGPAAAMADARRTADKARRPSSQVVTVHIDDRTILYDVATRGVARLNPAGSDTWRRLLAGRPLEDRDRPLVAELQSLGMVVLRSG